VTTSDDKPDIPEVGPRSPSREATPTRRSPRTRPPEGGFGWSRAAAFVILPVIAMLLGAAAGYLKWEDSSRT